MVFVEYDEFRRRTLDFNPGLAFFLDGGAYEKDYRKYYDREVANLSLSDDRMNELISTYWSDIIRQLADSI